MRFELSYHDIDLKELELKNNIQEAIKYQPDFISVYPYYAKFAKKLSNNLFQITCPIDYPLGQSDLLSRQTEIVYAIKNGASKVDIVIPTLYLANSKYDKFREDIRINSEICQHHNIEINYMLEYRIFNHNTLTKICNILKELGVPTVYASTGHMLDDITDNSIASMYLAKKTGIQTIINGDIWTSNHIKSLLTYKPYGIRFKKLTCVTINICRTNFRIIFLLV